jgi:hypothetical protein
MIQKKIFIILFCTLASCLPALNNRFPLIYPDTGSYIYSGFNCLFMLDRPIFYGLFLRHISLASSLWYVIFAQSFLINYLIFLVIRLFEPRKALYIYVLSITVLVLTTAFAHTVSILIPDIFTAIVLLSLILLLFDQAISRARMAFLSVLFVFSTITQISSVVSVGFLLMALSVFLIIRYAYLTSFFRRRCFLVLLLYGLSLLIVPTSNLILAGKFKLVAGKHVFAINHLIETGVLQSYLNEVCPKKDLAICTYKDSLGSNFIWDQKSALYRTGGWIQNEAEYNRIIYDVYSTPKYLIFLGQKAVEYGLVQFFSFNVQKPIPLLNHSAPFDQVKWRFKHNINEYISSRQSNNDLEVASLNVLQLILVIVSMSGVLLYLLFNQKNILTRSILLLFAFSLINSFCCSNLSTIDSRFQSRIIWIFPLFFIIIVYRVLRDAKFFKIFWGPQEAHSNNERP